MASVQYTGIDDVIQAFEFSKCECWSLWQGSKQMLSKGFGKDMLETYLTMLDQGGSQAVYTLKVYEGCSDATDVKSSTPFDGSFNFKLFQDNNPRQYAGIGPAGRNSGIVGMIQELKQEIQELKSQPAEDDEPETIGSVVDGAIIEIIKDPNKALTWLEVIKGIFNPNAAPAPIRPQLQVPATIGNVASNTAVDQLPMEEKLNRLEAALDKLEKKDPKLVEHLEKLAAMSDTQLKFLLTMLDTMK